jgi:hypothetical protein
VQEVTARKKADPVTILRAMKSQGAVGDLVRITATAVRLRVMSASTTPTYAEIMHSLKLLDSLMAAYQRVCTNR